MKLMLTLAIVVIIAGLYLFDRQRRTVQPETVVSSCGPTCERVQRLSSLVSSRVQLADVLIATGENCRGCWLVRGDAILSVDLSQAAIAERDEVEKRATIRLPPPKVLQARVDHERTKTWEVRSMTWLSWRAHPDALRDEVMLQAQRMIAQAAGSQENIAQAQRSAEAIIAALYEQVGWQVEVRWKEPPALAADVQH